MTPSKFLRILLARKRVVLLVLLLVLGADLAITLILPKLRTDPARALSEFFEARQLRGDIERARARLSEFQRSHGIMTDEQLAASTSPDVMQSPVIQQLRTEIARREAKLNELMLRLGPDHPQVKSAQAELESLRSELQRGYVVLLRRQQIEQVLLIR
jgi:uncharacterized protein involved in exopolysaccharide biosynthesis